MVTFSIDLSTYDYFKKLSNGKHNVVLVAQSDYYSDSDNSNTQYFYKQMPVYEYNKIENKWEKKTAYRYNSTDNTWHLISKQ